MVSLLARLGLAAVWLVSGWVKASDPQQTMVAVDAYRLVPDSMVRAVAIGLPAVELALGLLVLVGLAVRWTSIGSAVLLLVLIAGVASAWVRGLQIDCGCFGGGGQDSSVTWTDYASEIGRDIGFLALAGWLSVLPRAPLALGVGSRAGLRSGPRGGDEPRGEDGLPGMEDRDTASAPDGSGALPR